MTRYRRGQRVEVANAFRPLPSSVWQEATVVGWVNPDQMRMRGIPANGLEHYDIQLRHGAQGVTDLYDSEHIRPMRLGDHRGLMTTSKHDG